jgi:hypothetical protein
MDGDKYYFFEYDRPGKKTPGRTRWRMTIEDAKWMKPGARPIMETEEVRVRYEAWDNFEPYAPGTGPKHVGRKKG